MPPHVEALSRLWYKTRRLTANPVNPGKLNALYGCYFVVANEVNTHIHHN